MNVYIVYEISLWPFKQSPDFTLGNSLFGALGGLKMLNLLNISIQDIVLI